MIELGDATTKKFWIAVPHETLTYVDVHRRYDGGRTLLHLAAKHAENPKIIKILLNAKACGKTKDDDEKTPFDYVKENSMLQTTYAYKLLKEASE